MAGIIITCALTGSIHTPSMSPHLPITGKDIARQGIEAAQAGASILHLHARDPVTGRPSALLEHFNGFVPILARETDAVLNLSTGGSAVMSLDDRLAAPLAIAPEMASLNMGTMNFALYPMLGKDRNWMHDWEKPFLEDTDDLVFKNTPRDIARILTSLGQERGARFEFECYDLSHLYMLRHFADRGLIKPPYFIQFVFGVLGGMGPDPENLTHMKRIADKLFGDKYMFSVLAAGRFQMPLITMSAAMGGHVRVGLEDSLTIARGRLACSNAEQVMKIREIVERLGRDVMTPDQVRATLGLKGAGQINAG
ncbi:3-keto-5-aminohexanoate cleavage protein [Roseinatronobacter alkalisoli]|uniref:3-keto-5-aminohexanoate cleavage protein n=1 Tax=Roseinatronobacter alkalisoli TaxID=3028235 RepID=A0ABT5TDI1_9RHOB|nr:3-keto-5-aminohexanoate cleavage protein [Roseinatronobacter sp. HJB301]MDD7973071.1 3-keto-5-aminohexanoate cleavage protein [Roseinatronobacter sp. HJB301]